MESKRMTAETFLRIWLAILGDSTNPKVTYNEFIIPEFPKEHRLYSIKRNISRVDLEKLLVGYAIELVQSENPKALEYNPDLKISIIDVLEVQYRLNSILLKDIHLSLDYANIYYDNTETQGIPRIESRDQYEKSLMEFVVEDVTQAESLKPSGALKRT